MADLKNYLEAKKKGTSIKERASTAPKVNGRSADFIMASIATGCESISCAYCYTSRHREFGNPLTIYSNVDKVLQCTKQHWLTLPAKISNQCDPVCHTYDIGENTDMLSPKLIKLTDKVIQYFTEEMSGGPSPAKPTFATKLARGHLLTSVPKGRARVRVSLMPQRISSILELGSAQIRDRIASINKLYELGYEVHLNFSPVVVYKEWVQDYLELFKWVDVEVSDEVKRQLKAEVIFLTHHPKVHEMNLTWNSEAEDLLWQPVLQEYKTNERGDSQVLRYKNNPIKQAVVAQFKKMLEEQMDYCQIRYIF